MPEGRDRSSSPRSTMRRGRSGSPSRARGRSGSPSRARARSGSPSRARGRSGSPSRARGRSGSPSRARGRSGSPSRNRGRSGSRERMNISRSSSRDRLPSGRGRSKSRDRMTRSRSVSRDRLPGGSSRDRSSSPTSRRKDGEDFDDELPKRRRRRRGRRRSIQIAAQSMRRLAPAGESCTTKKMLSYAIPIVLIIASVIGLIVATGNANKITPTVLGRVVPTLDEGSLNDPFSGNPDAIPRWNNGGQGGLQVEILNALDDSWQVVFELAVADWEFGSPDAVTVTKERIPYEFDCTAVEGKVKVCNGDYGETQWRGINNALFDGNNFIRMSSAKMNEYYLEFDVEGTKQYTMCHELGHSMGLPHTDEDFDNEDLGNCLDYTNNFDENKHPDGSNYERLAELYGEVGSRRKQRGLRQQKVTEDVPRVPDHVLSMFHDAVSKLEKRTGEHAHKDGWRLLHKSKHGESHELTLVDGYTARVAMLLYHDPN